METPAADIDICDPAPPITADDTPAEAAIDALLSSLPCKCNKCAEIAVPPTDGISRDAASRFLQASYGDLNKSCHLLTSSCAWRNSFGVAQLMDEPPETTEARARALASVFPMGVHSRRTRAGHAIYILRVGYAVPSAGRATDLFRGESGVDAWLRHHVHCNEMCLRAKPQKLVLWDLANLGRAQMADPESFRLLRRHIQISIRHYPRTAWKVMLVNCPALLTTVWPAVAAMLDEATLAKVQLLGPHTSADVRQKLLAEVAEEDLPRYLGGTCEDAVPAGLHVEVEAAPAAATWREYFLG